MVYIWKNINMKSIVIILTTLTIILSSCKNDVTCDCEVSVEQWTNGDKTYSRSYTELKTIRRTTRRQAEKGQCADVEEKYYVDGVQTNKRTRCDILLW